MATDQGEILTINVGSSSIKFALFTCQADPQPILTGSISGIGQSSSPFKTSTPEGETQQENISSATMNEAVGHLSNWLKDRTSSNEIKAVGHRIVHGMLRTAPQKIDESLLSYLDSISSYDPDHLPAEIDAIRSLQKLHPSLPAFACFDTTFHAEMPVEATLLPIPKKYYDKGIKRYGFHGLSYSYLMHQIGREKEKIILAHLGSGCSMAAVLNGKSIDTTMGFTPAAGLMMSTRSGDLDPGVAWYLLKQEGMKPDEFNELVNRHSGLKGISGTGDMQELQRRREKDPEAALAIDIFCYHARKWIGALAAALGGLDLLVFSGGIGENDAFIRAAICRPLDFLGIKINTVRNEKHEPDISEEGAKVAVRVMRTNEEWMIARTVFELLQQSK